MVSIYFYCGLGGSCVFWHSFCGVPFATTRNREFCETAHFPVPFTIAHFPVASVSLGLLGLIRNSLLLSLSLNGEWWARDGPLFDICVALKADSNRNILVGGSIALFRTRQLSLRRSTCLARVLCVVAGFKYQVLRELGI